VDKLCRLSVVKTRFRNYATVRHLSALRNRAQKKGRPPPGGEEAEVVVYQPRGVGLMHTRHKPSNAHYTHGSAGRRKYCLPQKALDSGKDYSHPHVS
jgi:hypothetical protein